MSSDAWLDAGWHLEFSQSEAEGQFACHHTLSEVSRGLPFANTAVSDLAFLLRIGQLSPIKLNLRVWM